MSPQIGVPSTIAIPGVASTFLSFLSVYLRQLIIFGILFFFVLVLLQSSTMYCACLLDVSFFGKMFLPEFPVTRNRIF